MACVACGSTDDSPTGPSDEEYETEIRADLRHGASEDIQLLAQSVDDLCLQAPKLDWNPSVPGWDVTKHATAIDGMKVSWKWARSGYQQSKAPLSHQFPDTVARLDARYEDHSEQVSHDAFTGYAWSGLHAIERILWAGEIPTQVIEFESTLPGYVPASWPVTGQDAAQFERTLCVDLADDLAHLKGHWAVVTLQVDAVFLALASSMSEPRQELLKSVSGADASRYSQRTLADLRDALAGVRKTYEPYRKYLRSKSGGAKVDTKILAGLDALGSAYAEVPGDTFPGAPTTWSSENPSADDLATPFGKLYQAVDRATDPDDTKSLVYQLNLAKDLLGFTLDE